MKVLVVNPQVKARVYGPLADLSAIEIPVWALLIRQFLRRHNHEAELLDCEADGLSLEDAANTINTYKPDLAVFMVYGQQPSASTQCMPGAVALAELCECETICIGTHPSALPERTLRDGPWTYVCEGEGPITLMALLEWMNNDGEIGHVPGLWRWVGENIVRNARASNLQDLIGVIGDRGFSGLDFTKYRAHNWHAFGYPSRTPYASMQTSLGCSFRCSFCCINAPFGEARMRFWPPANVLADFERLADAGIVHVKIPDEMFLLNPRHVEDICDSLISLNAGFNIWAYARVDTLTEKLLEKLKAAGFNWLGVGVESGSSFVRDGVEKGRFGNEEIRSAIARVRSHGINVGANYIFGLPDDDEESMQATLDLACELNTEWANFYCAMAYPGSQLHTDAKKRGWMLPEDGPGWIGYSQHARDCLPLRTEKLSSAEVLAFRDKAFTEYFTRPRYLMMIQDRFGVDAVRDVKRMAEVKLDRTLLNLQEALNAF